MFFRRNDEVFRITQAGAALTAFSDDGIAEAVEDGTLYRPSSLALGREDRLFFTWTTPSGPRVSEFFTQPTTVTFTLSQVFGCEEETGTINTSLCPGGGPDGSGAGDFYALVTVGSESPVMLGPSGRSEFGDFDNNGEFLNFTTEVIGGSTTINVQILDEDGNDDDVIDVHPGDNVTALDIDLDLLTGQWTLNGISGPNTHSLRGDGDTEHLSNGGHPAIITFDISTLEPLDPDDYLNARHGDGILDGWEQFGLDLIDITQPNPVTSAAEIRYEVIPAIGQVVDVATQDVLVENDWIAGAPPNFRHDATNPDEQSYADIVESFTLAPTPMNLWFDTGTLTDGSAVAGYPDASFAPPAGDFGIDLGGGNEVELNAGPLAGVTTICSVHADSFYDVKDIHFNDNRRWVYRYAITGRDSVFAPGTDCPRGGQAEIGGNDILNLRGDVSVMMHELGHSLNLRHGGFEDEGCKPNYVSVMNYAYDNFVGIRVAGGDPLLDFSPARLSVAGGRTTLADDLDEGDLDEIPIQVSNIEHLFVFTDQSGNRLERTGDFDPDYNADGDANDTGVVANISRHPNHCDSDTEFENLEDHDDWGAISAAFRDFGDADDGVEISDETGMFETPEQAETARLEVGRADVAVSGDLVDDVLTVEVNAIDVDFLNLPEIDLTLDGFTIPMLPDDCTLTPTGASCKMPVALRSLTERQPPTESAVWTIQLTDTTPAIDSTVTVIATSEFNPLDNDPDPTNNTITLMAAAPPSGVSCETAAPTEPCVIPEGTTINGSLTRPSPILVLGEVTGDLKSNDGDIEVGSTGVVGGDITQNNNGSILIETGASVGGAIKDNGPGSLTIHGTVGGDVTENDAGDLTISEAAIVTGNAKENGDGSLSSSGVVIQSITETASGDLMVTGASTIGGNVKETGDGSLTHSGSANGTVNESGSGDLTMSTGASAGSDVVESNDGALIITDADLNGNAKESGTGSTAILGSTTIAGDLSSFGAGSCSVDPTATIAGNRLGQCAP